LPLSEISASPKRATFAPGKGGGRKKSAIERRRAELSLSFKEIGGGGVIMKLSMRRFARANLSVKQARCGVQPFAFNRS
jgi:hypothetical protein